MDRRTWFRSGLALTLSIGAAAAGLRGAMAQPPSAPFAGGPPALTGKWAEKAKKVDTLLAKQQKSPKDPKLKTMAAKESSSLGHELMVTQSPDLPPRVKYRSALKYLRAAQKLDPKDAQAKADINQIESIYKSMGMPVPK